MKLNKKVVSKGVWLSLLLTIWLRLLLFVSGYNLATRIHPIPVTTAGMDFAENIPDQRDPWFFIVQPLHRFDALWYEEIAQNHYKDQPLTASFFPLFPYLTQALSQVLNVTFEVTAFFLTTIFTFTTFFLLYLLACLEYDEKVALRTLLIYATFPTVFFLLTPYAEALLFTLILLALILAKQNKVVLSTLVAVLVTLTKPYGVAIIVPLGYVFLKTKSIKEKIFNSLYLFTIPVSFLAVKYYLDTQSKVAFSTVLSKIHWRIRIPLPWEPIGQSIQMLINEPFYVPIILYFITLIGGIFLLVKSWKVLKLHYFLLILTFMLIFYFFTFRGFYISSYQRYALIFFPLFMYLGTIKLNPTLEVIYLSTSTSLLVLLFILYILGYFVG